MYDRVKGMLKPCWTVGGRAMSWNVPSIVTWFWKFRTNVSASQPVVSKWVKPPAKLCWYFAVSESDWSVGADSPAAPGAGTPGPSPLPPPLPPPLLPLPLCPGGRHGPHSGGIAGRMRVSVGGTTTGGVVFAVDGGGAGLALAEVAAGSFAGGASGVAGVGVAGGAARVAGGVVGGVAGTLFVVGGALGAAGCAHGGGLDEAGNGGGLDDAGSGGGTLSAGSPAAAGATPASSRPADSMPADITRRNEPCLISNRVNA